jgi:integrase
LEFLILTAVRSGSVRQAEWSEIDFDKALWIIPPEHTKARQEHRVPLQPQAIALLKSLPVMAVSNIIFPSPKGKALSDMAFSQLMRGMRERGELTVEAVPHGFRSTFRDWISEKTEHSPEVAEMALAHTIGNKVERAYRRGNLMEPRRRLMNDWALFCLTGRWGNIVNFPERKSA